MELTGGLRHQLRPRRESSERLVVGEFEAEEAFAREQRGLHRHRVVSRPHREHLEPACLGKPLADRPEEIGAGSACQSGALVALPPRGLEGEELLDGLRVAGALYH